jgi:hypothetical protein
VIEAKVNVKKYRNFGFLERIVFVRILTPLVQKAARIGLFRKNQ